MLRFKTFLLEYLTDGQREKFSHIKMTDKARKDTDHFFGVGNDIVKEPLISDYTKSETHEDVENHLGISIPAEHYIKGVATDKYGRLSKIGKQIKDPSLLQRFSNDTARSNSSKPSDNYVTIVRGTEVAGQTNPVPDAEHPKGHSWKDQSCKNIENGCNRQFLEPEIQQGSVLFRVHDGKTGEEIHRTIIQPYHNKQGETVYGLDGQYGVRNDRYTQHAENIAARLSNSSAQGTFTINRSVYQDHAPGSILSPVISPEEISKILQTKSSDFANVGPKLTLLSSHKRVTSQQLTDAIDEGPKFAFAALQNPNITIKHIQQILGKPYDSSIKTRAIIHPSFKSSHISNFLDNFDDKNPMHKSLIKKIYRNPNLNNDHINKLIGYNIEDVDHNLANNINLDSNQIHQLIDRHSERNFTTTNSGFILDIIGHRTDLNNDHINKISNIRY